MLKISEHKHPNHTVTLRLEGRIVGPWVEELKQACDPLGKSGSRKLVLDLAEVSFADEQGLTLLSSLKARGIKLLNPAPFVEEQLKTATRF